MMSGFVPTGRLTPPDPNGGRLVEHLADAGSEFRVGDIVLWMDRPGPDGFVIKSRFYMRRNGLEYTHVVTITGEASATMTWELFRLYAKFCDAASGVDMDISRNGTEDFLTMDNSDWRIHPDKRWKAIFDHRSGLVQVDMKQYDMVGHPIKRMTSSGLVQVDMKQDDMDGHPIKRMTTVDDFREWRKRGSRMIPVYITM